MTRHVVLEETSYSEGRAICRDIRARLLAEKRALEQKAETSKSPQGYLRRADRKSKKAASFREEGLRILDGDPVSCERALTFHRLCLLRLTKGPRL
jgi:hypothetical protein